MLCGDFISATPTLRNKKMLNASSNLEVQSKNSGADPGGGGGGGVDWVSSHPPMGFNRRQEQLLQHKN